MLTTILATIIVLGVLIFVHELGHFLVAKAVDIEVPKFSIGFGPTVVGFKRGETEYVISALPLGGYVKMAGMEEMERVEGPDPPRGEAEPRTGPRPRDFESKPLWARTAVISAGVIMNLLFAIFVFALIAFVWGMPAVPEARIGGVVLEALPAGTEPLARVPHGARVTHVGDYAVGNFEDLQFGIARARTGPVELRFADAPPITIALPPADAERGRLLEAILPVLDTPPLVGSVVRGEPAARGGLRSGDRVLRAGGRDIMTWQQLVEVIEASPGRSVPVEVDRQGEVVRLEVVPDPRTLADGYEYGRIGVQVAPAAFGGLPRETAGPIAAAAYGMAQTWRVTTIILDFLGGLFTGRQSPRDVGGPLMIGEMSGQFARAGLLAFLSFMALFSVNLAILNLLPIPVLDGGHLVFLAIEAVRGRALSVEQRIRFTQVGLVIIIGLMVWAFGNDLLRYFGI